MMNTSSVTHRWMERIRAAALIIVGIFYLVGIFQIKVIESSQSEIGPKSFPFLLVAILFVLTAALLARQEYGFIKGTVEPSGGGWPPAKKSTVAVLLILLYVAAVQAVGFIWATPLFFGLFSWVFGNRHLYSIITCAIGLTGLLHFLLSKVFGVILP